jgi:hypothetical protein
MDEEEKVAKRIASFKEGTMVTMLSDTKVPMAHGTVADTEWDYEQIGSNLGDSEAANNII